MLPLAAFPMHCYPARCDPILPFNSKRSRLPDPVVRGGMVTPVGATGSKVRLARDTGRTCDCVRQFASACLKSLEIS